jgi:hypothetical protein
MKALTIFKTAVSYFCTFGVGACVCLAVVYGFDPMIIVGLVLSSILAICAGIGAKQDREQEWQEAMWAETESKCEEG